MKNKIYRIILSITMTLSIMIGISYKEVDAAYATYNYYNSSTDYQYACTYIASESVKQNLGITIPQNWGNGGSWFANAQRDGYSTYLCGSTVPQPGWLVVWTGPTGAPGHVAYIKSVNTSNQTMVIHEGGSGWKGNVHGVIDRSVSYVSNSTSQSWNGVNYTITMKGFINPKKGSTPNVSVSFSDWSSPKGYTFIKDTNASIGQKVNVSSGNWTRIGIYLYTSNGVLLKYHFQSPSSGYSDTILATSYDGLGKF